MDAPRRLANNPLSPFYDKEALLRVDKVFVDGNHIPNCVAYDMDKGWAFGIVDGVWQPRHRGVVTVTMKE